jgi:hypothetical protein
MSLRQGYGLTGKATHIQCCPGQHHGNFSGKPFGSARHRLAHTKREEKQVQKRDCIQLWRLPFTRFGPQCASFTALIIQRLVIPIAATSFPIRPFASQSAMSCYFQ